MNTKSYYHVRLLGSQGVLLTHCGLGLGEWSLHPGPCPGFGWPGLPICRPSSQAVIWAGAIHLLVLHYLFCLSNWLHSQRVISKVFPNEERWPLLFPLCFRPLSRPPPHTHSWRQDGLSSENSGKLSAEPQEGDLNPTPGQ